MLLPIVPGDSARGEKLFAAERRAQCHSVAGACGTTAPDLWQAGGSKFHARAAGKHDVESRARHARAATQGAGIEKPKLSAGDAA